MKNEKVYLLDYDYKGRWCTTNLTAKSWNEAEARLKAIKDTGDIEGELKAEISLKQAAIDEARNRRQQRRVRNKTLGMRRTRREAPPDDDAAEQIVTKLLKMKAGESPS